MFSRRDRSPCPRLTLPSLRKILETTYGRGCNIIVPSSFSSSLAAGASAAPPAAAAAPPAAGAAAAPPPEPTFRSISFTSLPSSACRLSTYARLNSFDSTDFSEEGGPDGLDFLDAGGFDEGGQFVGGNLDTIVGEDQGRVGIGELSARHFRVI